MIIEDIPAWLRKPCKRKITLLVVHCTASRCNSTLTPDALDRLHRQRGFNGCGYHYYVSTDGTITEMRPADVVGAHTLGYNLNSLGIAYEGGLLPDGTPADTRTPAQKIALRFLLTVLRSLYPAARICGHRDLSPDKNGDGIIEPGEWIKVCPCFDASQEYADI